MIGLRQRNGPPTLGVDQQLAHLAGLWKSIKRRLAKQQCIVDREFKHAVARRRQDQFAHKGRELAQHFSHQTGGILGVVSYYAVFDAQCVFGRAFKCGHVILA